MYTSEVVSRGGRGLDYQDDVLELQLRNNGNVIFVFYTIPDQYGSGGAGGSTDATWCLAAYDLPLDARYHAGNAQRILLFEYATNHQDLNIRKRVVGLTPETAVLEDLLPEYTKNRPHDTDRQIDRATIRGAVEYVARPRKKGKPNIAVIDAKFAGLLFDMFSGLDNVRKEDQPIVIFVGVTAQRDVALERFTERENEKKRIQAKITGVSPAFLDEFEALQIRIERLVNDAFKVESVYEKRYTPRMLRLAAHYILNSTEASPPQQIKALIDYICKEHYVLGSYLLKYIMLDRLRVQELPEYYLPNHYKKKRT